MSSCEAFLRQHGIPYERFDHPAVYTCEDAERLRLDIPGAETKNLFLRDKPGRKHYLVSVPPKKKVDLKALALALHAQQGLSFGSDERLMKYLGVTPGSVTILGLMNDAEHAVQCVIDTALWSADAVACHPLVNTATLVIPHAGLVTFLEKTGHAVNVCDVPAK